MRKFITDQGMAATPTLGGLGPEEREAALNDADRVYGYLRRSEAQREGFVPEDALREWGEQNGIGPDRMNLALGVLADTNRVTVVGPPVPTPAPAGTPGPPQTEVRRTTMAPPGPGPADAGIPPESDQAEQVDTSALEDRTVEELQEMAAARNLKGRSSMNKAELVEALAADPEPEDDDGE